ncbi:uncharacterized protein LOC110836842 isoform X3 [Zootermopsis nevadensis]|uniref:uncharacterized protein LOC110836842 isoform X3 n=1 Tax=Zootermopsis nevadensis TaxID=136037 RepID=UPI000B8E9463|nr:uncharacterized protein LOC110836842 isoform X3 [Zootermopsis nevadensis]
MQKSLRCGMNRKTSLNCEVRVEKLKELPRQKAAKYLNIATEEGTEHKRRSMKRKTSSYDEKHDMAKSKQLKTEDDTPPIDNSFNIQNLPEEMLSEIFLYTGTYAKIGRLREVCRRFDAVCSRVLLCAFNNIQKGIEQISKQPESYLLPTLEEQPNEKRKKPQEQAKLEHTELPIRKSFSSVFECLAWWLRVVRAWVLPCISAGVCSFYCGRLLDEYHTIMLQLPTKPVPTDRDSRCDRESYNLSGCWMGVPWAVTGSNGFRQSDTIQLCVLLMETAWDEKHMHLTFGLNGVWHLIKHLYRNTSLKGIKVQRLDYITQENYKFNFTKLGYQLTWKTPAIYECTTWQDVLTFEIEVTCDKETLPQSLAAETLQIQPNGDETPDSSYYQFKMVINCPDLAKWCSFKDIPFPFKRENE